MRFPSSVASIVLASIPTSLGDAPSGEIPPFAKAGAVVESGPPILAFDGRDLSRFYAFTRYHKYEDPDRVFEVRDGMIRVSGREVGALTTRESFSDYHLIVEYRWGGRTWYPRRFKARNSGIMVHADGDDGEALAFLMSAYECQLIEGGSGDLIVVPTKGHPLDLTSEVRDGADGQSYYHKGGEARSKHAGRFNWWGRDPSWKDSQWFRGPLDVEKPVGEWNRMEVTCDGDSITCVLNGILVNAGTKASRTSGKILLQSEGAEVFFRKFEVRPLRK